MSGGTSSGSSVDWSVVRESFVAGALFEAANATIVPDGKFSLTQGAVSFASDWVSNKFIADMLMSFLPADPKMQMYMREYFAQPLGAAALYVLLAKCGLKIDNRGWIVPFLTQFGSSAAAGFVVDKWNGMSSMK